MSQAVERVVRAIVIGHVDSGKSTLSGQLAILTERVDRRAIEKIEAEVRLMKKHGGAPPAWVMDDGAERESGNTVECGQIRIDTGNKLVHIIDAPGHERYVRHMVKEVPNADVAVLVVPAPRTTSGRASPAAGSRSTPCSRGRPASSTSSSS